jgi:hypothetical protein
MGVIQVKFQSEQTRPSPDLVDAVVDRYVGWREKSSAVSAAYEAWDRAGSSERGSAFGAYVAALDREEGAATEYMAAVEQVRKSWPHLADKVSRAHSV